MPLRAKRCAPVDVLLLCCCAYARAPVDEVTDQEQARMRQANLMRLLLLKPKLDLLLSTPRHTALPRVWLPAMTEFMNLYCSTISVVRRQQHKRTRMRLCQCSVQSMFAHFFDWRLLSQQVLGRNSTQTLRVHCGAFGHIIRVCWCTVHDLKSA